MNITAGESYYAPLPVEIRQHKDKKRFTVTVATGSVDRHRTRVMPEGMDVSHFMRNPVVLFNHNYDRIVARAVSMEIKGGKLQAVVEFNEGNAFALEKMQEVESGFLNAISPGFMVKGVEPDLEDETVLNITESELLEFSFVSVQSIRDSLVLSRDASELRAIKEELASLRKEIADAGTFRVSGEDLMTSIKRSANTETDEPDSSQQDATEAAEAPDSPVEDAIPTAEAERDAEPAAEEPTTEPAEDGAIQELSTAPDSSLEETERAKPGDAPSPSPRQATAYDYAKIVEAMLPAIRTTVRRQLGRE